MNLAQKPKTAHNRYSKSLEQAPGLLASLEDYSSQELSLNSEVGVARMLLEQILEQLGAAHAKVGQISPMVAESVARLLAQVQSMVQSAAAIEAKRVDQKISATHMLALLVGLRNDLKRRLTMAFGEAAGDVVDSTFGNAKWTGSLRDEDVHDALLEPAAFDLRLRPVDRQGDQLVESAKALGLSSPELLALAADAEDVRKHDPLALPPMPDENPVETEE